MATIEFSASTGQLILLCILRITFRYLCHIDYGGVLLNQDNSVILPYSGQHELLMVALHKTHNIEPSLHE